MNALIFILSIIAVISVSDAIEAHIKRKEIKDMDVKFSDEQNQKYLQDIQKEVLEIEEVLIPVKEIIYARETQARISQVPLDEKTHVLMYLGKVLNKITEIEKLGKKGIDNE